jgi:ADP-heptose:LPS heptosyltransferase
MLTALLLLLNKSCRIGIVALADDKICAEEIVKLVTLNNSELQELNIEIISDTNIFSVASKLNSYEYYIGADGGLLHVAAALGMKCIGLYNTNVKEIWHPWTPYQVSLSADISYTIARLK